MQRKNIKKETKKNMLHFDSRLILNVNYATNKAKINSATRRDSQKQIPHGKSFFDLNFYFCFHQKITTQMVQSKTYKNVFYNKHKTKKLNVKIKANKNDNNNNNKIKY